MLTSLDLKIMNLAKEHFLKLDVEKQHMYLLQFLEEKFLYDNNLTPESYDKDLFIHYLYDNDFIYSTDRSTSETYIKIKTLEVEKHFDNTLPNIIIPYIYSKYKNKLIKYFITEGKFILEEMILGDIYIKHGTNDILKSKLKNNNMNITDFEVNSMLTEIYDIFTSKGLSDIIDLSEENLQILNINHEKLLKNSLIYCCKKLFSMDVNLIEATEFLSNEFDMPKNFQSCTNKSVCNRNN